MLALKVSIGWTILGYSAAVAEPDSSVPWATLANGGAVVSSMFVMWVFLKRDKEKDEGNRQEREQMRLAYTEAFAKSVGDLAARTEKSNETASARIEIAVRELAAEVRTTRSNGGLGSAT